MAMKGLTPERLQYPTHRILLRLAAPPASHPFARPVAGGAAHAGLKDYLLNPDDPIQEVSVVLGSEDGKFAFNPRCEERSGCTVCRVAKSGVRVVPLTV